MEWTDPYALPTGLVVGVLILAGRRPKSRRRSTAEKLKISPEVVMTAEELPGAEGRLGIDVEWGLAPPSCVIDALST